MGNDQSNINRAKLPTDRDHPFQYILIAGGPSVVIFQGLIDQIHQNNIEKQDGKILDEVIDQIRSHFPHYLNDFENSNTEEFLIRLWHKPNFREEYFENRFKVDPYLVLPTILTNLERGITFNHKRACYFKHATRQRYFTETYSKTTSNHPFKASQELTFELFANCFSADTWADVVAVSFSLSDYDNDQYLEEFYRECKKLTQFTTYRIIVIFTHLEILYEKVKLGLTSYKGDRNLSRRKELAHLPPECALIINDLTRNSFKIMKQLQDNYYPNRTYECHLVNTSSDHDMKQLLDCLCIGANTNRRFFISSNIETISFPFSPSFKPKLFNSLKLNQLCDLSFDWNN